MERLDSAATGLIEQEVRGRFPDGAMDSVAVLQYGDDPAVEPGQIVIQVTIASAAEAEGDEDPLQGFHQAFTLAISNSMLLGVGAAAVSVVVAAIFLKEIPLRTSTAAQAAAAATGASTGRRTSTALVFAKPSTARTRRAHCRRADGLTDTRVRGKQ